MTATLLLLIADKYFILTYVIYVKRIWLTTEVRITEKSEVKLQIKVRYSWIKIKFVIVHINWFRVTSFER